MILSFSVSADGIIRTDKNGDIAAKSKGVVTCAFLFDDAWDAFPTRHLFCMNPEIVGHVEIPILDAGNAAVLSETALSVPARLAIGAYGVDSNGQRIVTKLIGVTVKAGAYGFPSNIPDPPQSVYEQLMTAIGAAVSAADSAANHADNLDLEIGDLSLLTTDDKSDLVHAINEVDAHADYEAVRNDSQDEQLSDVAEEQLAQNERLYGVEETNTTQDARLDALEYSINSIHNEIANNGDYQVEQDERISALEAAQVDHEARITSLEAERNIQYVTVQTRQPLSGTLPAESALTLNGDHMGSEDPAYNPVRHGILRYVYRIICPPHLRIKTYDDAYSIPVGVLLGAYTQEELDAAETPENENGGYSGMWVRFTATSDGGVTKIIGADNVQIILNELFETYTSAFYLYNPNSYDCQIDVVMLELDKIYV